VDQAVPEAHLPGQPDRLGTAVEHRLGADVDQHPADLGAGQLAADGRRALQHEDLDVGGGPTYRCGGRQAGDAATHDHHARGRGGDGRGHR
jgi:hypothetical protein